MAKTLAQIQKEINRLQQEAEVLRQREVAGVVERIQVAIAHYGLTVEDLFGTTKATRRGATGGRRQPASPPKYHDGQGKTWTGHGKRPAWFKAALARGQTAESMLINPVAAA